jgi:hypothetical protein
MRAGPSDSDCRVRVQIAKSGVGPMAEVVSVLAKGEMYSSDARWGDERE